VTNPAGPSVVEGEDAMRFVYIALIVVFTGIVALFKVQNLDSVSVSLLQYLQE